MLKDINFECNRSVLPIVLITFIITTIKFDLNMGFAATVCLMGSLLAHEVAHAVVAHSLGIKVKAIGFCKWGGFTRRERGEGIAEILTTSAGPAVNAFIMLACWYQTGLLGWLGQMNAILVFINLFPAFNSDGHRLWKGSRWNKSQTSIAVAD